MSPYQPISKDFLNIFSFAKAISPIAVFIGGVVLIAYLYGWLLEDFIISDMLYVYAGIATFFTIIGLLRLLYSAGSGRTEKRALQSALANRPPRDGKVYAFMGTLEPDGELLRTPFTDKSCILYEYSLTQWVGSSSHGHETRNEVMYSGFHLCPAHIHTTRGPITLAAYPPAIGFVSQLNIAQPINHNVGGFLKSTDFKDGANLNYVQQVGESFARLTGNAEPPISEDISFTNKPDLDKLEVNEEYIPPGVEVYLLAKYDAQRQAAVWYSGMKMSPLDRNLLREWARGSLLRGVVWGLIFISIGFVIGLLPLTPSSLLEDLGTPGGSMLEHRKDHLWSAIRLDAMPIAWHVVSILEPDSTDGQGRTLLMSANGPRMTRLLLERGADPNARDNYGKTALQHRSNLDAAKVLLEHGADASVLTGGYAARLFFSALNELDVRGTSLFLQNRISPEYYSAEGTYPLNVVVSKCSENTEDRVLEISGMLLDKGSLVNVQDSSGLTAMQLATRQCGSEIINLLRDAERSSGN